MSSLKPLLWRLAGVLLFLYLLFWKVGVDALVQSLQSIRLPYLLAVIPFHLAQWALRTLRWRTLLADEQIAFSFGELFSLSTASFFLGCWTPGRVGEFIKVKFLMNAGHSFRQAFLPTLLERLLDVLTLIVYVAVGAVFFFPHLPTSWRTYLVWILAILLVVGLLVFQRRAIQKGILRLLPEKLSGDVESRLRIFKDSLRRLGRHWKSIAWQSLAVWGLNYWMIYLLYRGAGHTLPIPVAFALAAMGSLAGLVPLTVYGVGIREALLIALFQLIGYSPAQASVEGLVFGLMFMVLLIYHVVLGFLCWLRPAMRPFLKKVQSA